MLQGVFLLNLNAYGDLFVWPVKAHRFINTIVSLLVNEFFVVRMIANINMVKPLYSYQGLYGAAS